MAQIKFTFKEVDTIIQCNKDDKMDNILEKYGIKIEKEINKLIFLYNGAVINKELKFEEQANEQDKKLGKMNIIVNEINELNKENDKNK